MSGHPTLTTSVYIGIVVVFCLMMAYWFFYTRSVRSKNATLNRTGSLPVSRQEGIAEGTEARDRSTDTKL